MAGGSLGSFTVAEPTAEILSVANGTVVDLNGLPSLVVRVQFNPVGSNTILSSDIMSSLVELGGVAATGSPTRIANTNIFEFTNFTGATGTAGVSQQVTVPAGPGEDGHELDGRAEEVRELLRRLLHLQPIPQVLLLRRDAHRAVVRVAGAHPQTTDRLERRVGDGNRVGTQGERLHEVGLGA